VVLRTGGDLIVGVKDPAHPGVPFAQLDKITLQNWTDANDRIELFRFADGSRLDLAAGESAITARYVPFGETLSHSSVVEMSAIGMKIATVSGFDFNPNAALSYSLSANALHPNRRVTARGAVRAGGWRRAQRAGASMACISRNRRFCSENAQYENALATRAWSDHVHLVPMHGTRESFPGDSLNRKFRLLQSGRRDKEFSCVVSASSG
jgi:hypothetical protein